VSEPSGPTVTVGGHDETDQSPAELLRCRQVAQATLEAEDIGYGHLDLIFTDPEAMAELNRTHLGAEGPTDVLAFPLDGPDLVAGVIGPGPAAESGVGDSPQPHLGDVVICPEVARRQAAEHTGTYDAEMTLLVVHGILHVLGHDHAEPIETALMQGRERVHLARHGYRHPVEG